MGKMREYLKSSAAGASAGLALYAGIMLAPPEMILGISSKSSEMHRYKENTAHGTMETLGHDDIGVIRYSDNSGRLVVCEKFYNKEDEVNPEDTCALTDVKPVFTDRNSSRGRALDRYYRYNVNRLIQPEVR